MRFFYLIALSINIGIVRTGILSDFTSSVSKGAYSVVRGTVFTAQEVIGKPIELNDLNFYVFGSHNRGREQKLDPRNPKELEQAHGKIFFLIHGWFHTKRNNPWYGPLTSSLLSKYPDAHVIQVDWEKGSTQEYSLAAFSTESVGKLIAEIINILVTKYRIPLKNVVCIGHSLGGQTCGWVGRFFKQMSHKKLQRIVALDPAGPLFTLRPDSKRLNPEDAEVVEVIHSDGGKLGFEKPCGTIDFFPNGGTDQPGCAHIDLRNPLKLADPVSCDHERSYDYLIEAVAAPLSFLAQKCSNEDELKKRNCHGIEVPMGDLETLERGLFYLTTNSKSPFSNSIRSSRKLSDFSIPTKSSRDIEGHGMNSYLGNRPVTSAMENNFSHNNRGYSSNSNNEQNFDRRDKYYDDANRGHSDSTNMNRRPYDNGNVRGRTRLGDGMADY